MLARCHTKNIVAAAASESFIHAELKWHTNLKHTHCTRDEGTEYACAMALFAVDKSDR